MLMGAGQSDAGGEESTVAGDQQYLENATEFKTTRDTVSLPPRTRWPVRLGVALIVTGTLGALMLASVPASDAIADATHARFGYRAKLMIVDAYVAIVLVCGFIWPSLLLQWCPWLGLPMALVNVFVAWVGVGLIHRRRKAVTMVRWYASLRLILDVIPVMMCLLAAMSGGLYLLVAILPLTVAYPGFLLMWVFREPVVAEIEQWR